MFDTELHRTILTRIMRDVYADAELRTLLGFKGGTAAMLFYDLPRLSVDLDFDLLDPTKKEIISVKLSEILAKYGDVRQVKDKFYTLFFLLSYGSGERTLKLEVSKRTSTAKYEPKPYLGIPALVMVRDDMVACKLTALVGRRSLAGRDLFDLHYFLKSNWQPNIAVVESLNKKPIIEVIDQAIDKINTLKRSSILQGLGELVNEKQKVWLRDSLKDELIFELGMLKERVSPKTNESNQGGSWYLGAIGLFFIIVGFAIKYPVAIVMGIILLLMSGFQLIFGLFNIKDQDLNDPNEKWSANTWLLLFAGVVLVISFLFYYSRSIK